MSSPPLNSPVSESPDENWATSLPGLPPSLANSPYYEDEEQDSYPYHRDLPYQPPTLMTDVGTTESDSSLASASSLEVPSVSSPDGSTKSSRKKLRPLMLSPRTPMFAVHNPQSGEQELVPASAVTQDDMGDLYQAPVPSRRSAVPLPVRRNRTVLDRPPRKGRRTRQSASPTKAMAPAPSVKPPQSGSGEALKLRLELNLDVHVEIKAKVHGDVTLSLME